MISNREAGTNSLRLHVKINTKTSMTDMYTVTNASIDFYKYTYESCISKF